MQNPHCCQAAVASLSDAISCRGLLVHAESEQARSFYEHLMLLKNISHWLQASWSDRQGRGNPAARR